MPASSLKSSKHAPKTPLETLALSKAEKLKQEKAKATRLLGRLQWKSQSLVASYVRALDILRFEVDQNGHIDSRAELHYAFMLGTSSKQAETMFKVDFFEFYTLLERYITVCLGIVGVYVSANAPRTNVNALRFITNPDLQRTRPDALHAFHANLLEALDQESCPLYAALGTQEVRIQLGFAKDYRNAWKDADESAPNRTRDEEQRKKLPDFDLDKMLRTLLRGCEQAHTLTQEYAGSKLNGVTSRDFEPQSYSYNPMDMEDVPYEYMYDAMDLD